MQKAGGGNLKIKFGINRTFLAGYLQALEDMNIVTSREVGPARVYYNKRDHRGK